MVLFNSQKTEDKIFISKFKRKAKSKVYHIANSKTRGQTSVDLDVVAYDEPPHEDLHCLQIQLFSSLVVKELIKQ